MTPENDAPDPEGRSSGDSFEARLGQDGAAEGQKPHQRILKSKGFVPVVVLIALIAFVLLSSRLAGRPPQIDSITPSRGKPGTVLLISGRYFEQERGSSEVRISGIAPTSSDYLDWSDRQISVRIPDGATSGIVNVITRSGRSSGLLWVNQDQIPVPASGPSRPGEPYITDIKPSAAQVGDTITITGMNFGLEKDNSEVYFTPAAGGDSVASAGFDSVSMLPANQDDFDYLSWSDREITLRVPDGATSGNVVVKSDKAPSNPVYFELLGGVGTKLYGAPRKYSVQYAMDVDVSAASGENTLYLWLPSIIQTPEQRRSHLVSEEPQPLAVRNGPRLYSLTNLQKGNQARAILSWIFDRYTVETQVSLAKPIPAYDDSTDLYHTFTQPDEMVPSNNPDLMKAAAAVIGAEKSPYLKARRIYDWLLGQVTYAETASNPLLVLRQKRADAFAFSSVFCALLRASGVPARMVSGYLVGETGQPTRRHFWDEFYLPTFGWVPVDPLLGDDPSLYPMSVAADFDSHSYYFGNLDNQHVTFSKGLTSVNQMSPMGKARQFTEFPYLVSIDEETVGGLTLGATTFEDLAVTGTY